MRTRWVAGVICGGLMLGMSVLSVSCSRPGSLDLSSDRTANDAGGGLSLDPGGFTVDLSSGGLTVVTGDDVLQNGNMEELDGKGCPAVWTPQSYVWLPTPDPARRPKLHERVKPLMRWESNAEAPHGGSRALFLAIPKAAHDPQDPPHECCAYWNQSLVLADSAEPKKYVLTCHHRGSFVSDVPGVSDCDAFVRVSFYDSEAPGQGKATRVYAQALLKPIAEWGKGRMSFVAPKGTRRLDVWLAMRGCGEVCFDDVSLAPTLIQDRGPTVRLMPWALLDKLYQLSTGDAGVMVFGFYNEAAAKIEQPQLLLRLPQGIEILELAPPAKMLDSKPIQDGALTEHRIDVSAWKTRIHDGTFAYPYNMWEGLLLALRTSLPAGASRYKASYWLEDGAYRMTPLDFEMQIVAPVPAVTGPKTFRSGAVMFLVQALRHEAAVKAFADLYKRVGFNTAQTGGALNTELGRLGIERYPQPFANGYTFGDRTPGKKPEDAVFRLVDGQPLWEAVCPVEVYARGPYFRQGIENDILRKILVTERSGEQIMANWEPPMYNGRGCFCNRCREEFKAYSKLPPAQVDRIWPKDVIHQHGDLWVKFRSWQHGKLMATIEETVNALGKEVGLDSHFIPEIHYGLLTESWEENSSNREYAAVDYLDKLPVLEPWAPYNWYVFGRGPYDYVRGLHLSCHTTAQDVRRFLAGRLPPEKQPRLLAFPYGTYEGATQPEALGFELLTYFVNGYAGAFVYLFPGGYDARYWKALAETNRQLALFEPFVCGGKSVRRHELKPETPLPKPDPRFLASGCAHPDSAKRWQDLPLLLSWEFEKNGARLFAVGNFWERGECFFRLTPLDLDPRSVYVLHEPAARRVYTDRNGCLAQRASDLGKGVLLHAGAMRYSFFVLEPYREGSDYGAAVPPQDMEAAMKERLPAIEARFRSEVAPVKAAKEAAAPRTEIKAMRKNGLECREAKVEGIATPCLLLQSPSQSIIVDPATGGRIVSWKIGGFEAAHREDPYGLFLDGFWKPPLQITQPYAVAAQEETPQGLKVVLRRVLGADGGRLNGVTIRKTIHVRADTAGFKVTTEITNTSENTEIEFSYRWHNMPAFLEQGQGKTGWVRMEKGGQPVTFTRKFTPRAFRRAAEPDEGLDAVPTDPKDVIDSNLVTLGCESSPIQIRIQLKPDSLYSIVFWDEGGMNCSTFELVFARTRLKYGETWTAETVLAVHELPPQLKTQHRRQG